MTTTFKPEIRTLADTLKAELKLGANGIVEANEGAFEKTLVGTDVTIEQITKIQDHTANVLAAAALAVGELGLAAFKADTNLKQTSLSLPAGRDSLNLVFQREKIVPAGTGPDAGTQTKYGVVTSRIDVAAHANRGSLKKVKDHLNATAKEMLAS